MSSILRASVILAVAAGVISGACGSSQPAAEIRTVTVTRGGVIQLVAVSGSVNAAAQVRLNFKTTGKLAEVYVTVGLQVTAGQPLAKLDTSDLEVAVAQAQAGLAGAQANYDKLIAGATPEDVALARQAVDNAQRSLGSTQRSGQNDVSSAQQSLARLQTRFQAARSTVASLSTDIRSEIGAFTIDAAITQLNQARTDLNALLNANGGNQSCTGASCPSPGQTTQTASEGKSAQTSLSSASVSFANAQTLAAGNLSSAVADYTSAADALVDIATRFDAAVQAGQETAQLDLSYQSVQGSFSTASVRLGALLDQLSASLTSAQNSITSAQSQFASTASRNDQSYESVRQELLPLQQALSTQLLHLAVAKNKTTQSANPVGTLTEVITGGYVTALENVMSVQERTNSSISNAQNALQNTTLSLQKATAPAASYEIAAAYASLLAQSASLAAAQNNLGNAVLKAPVTGVVASVANQVGEFASSVAGGFIVLANVSSVALHGTVGEADVAKLALGQVATIAVDAVGSARMTGKVTSIDPVATIAQGVPVYGVDVTVDIPNQAVRPGMSGTANVIIASHSDVLVVPNLAVKNQGGRRYVTLLQNGQQVDTDTTVGLVNDTVTELVSGVSEGDTVVLPQPRAAGSARPVQIGPGGGRLGG